MQDVRVCGAPPLVRNPGKHTLHDDDPGLLYVLSAPHCATTLLPSHDEPAVHDVQLDRVCLSPPLVLDPAAHVWHSVAPVLDAYMVSSMQLMHCEPSLLENLPRVHRVILLEPSQEDPGVHFEHVVLMVSALPEVKYPTGHVEHSFAPAEL